LLRTFGGWVLLYCGKPLFDAHRSSRSLELFDLCAKDVPFQETQIAVHLREDGSFFLCDVMRNNFPQLANKRSKVLTVARLFDPSNELSRLRVLLFGLVREGATPGYALSERGVDDLLLGLRM
jgi:hypothetical protein